MNIVLFDELQGVNTLEGTDYRARHIKKILKLSVGDHFKAGVINTSSGQATITSMTTDTLEFTYRQETPAPPLYPITLIVGMVRPISMRRILREAVSLGVKRLILTVTDTGEKSYLEAGLYTSGEYKAILLDGAMQSGHCQIPEVLFSASIDELSPLNGTLIALDNVQGSLGFDSIPINGEDGVSLAVGPERGFSDRERTILSGRGFILARFGDRILRTETVCSSALGVLLSRLGFL